MLFFRNYDRDRTQISSNTTQEGGMSCARCRMWQTRRRCSSSEKNIDASFRAGMAGPIQLNGNRQGAEKRRERLPRILVSHQGRGQNKAEKDLYRKTVRRADSHDTGPERPNSSKPEGDENRSGSPKTRVVPRLAIKRKKPVFLQEEGGQELGTSRRAITEAA